MGEFALKLWYRNPNFIIPFVIINFLGTKEKTLKENGHRERDWDPDL
jgi:hypothetical protein